MRPTHYAFGSLVVFLCAAAPALVGCGAVDAGSIVSSSDGSAPPSGDGGLGNNDSGDSKAPGYKCPTTLPADGTACFFPLSTECTYTCDDDRKPGVAKCLATSNGARAWSTQNAGSDCPPKNNDPIQCGSTTCTGSQYCMTPCCGGPAPLCEPMSDAGTCAPGLVSGACYTLDGHPCCQQPPCTPPAPYCVDSAQPTTECTLEPGTRTFRCLCA